MASELLELSAATADAVYAPGDYSCSFRPKTLHPGDALYLKTAAIDAAIAPGAGQINVPEALELSFSFAVWEQNTGFDPALNGLRVGDAEDYEMYVALRWPLPMPPGQAEPAIVTRTVTLPAGVYTAPSLAETVTRLCVAPRIVDTGADFQSFAFAPFAPSPYELGFYRDPPTQDFLSSFIMCHLNLDAGQVDLFAAYQWLLATVANGWTPAATVMLGALNFALLFDEDGSGAFSILAHTPFMSPAGVDQTPLVREYFNANQFRPGGDRRYMGGDSGILLTDLQPRAFWQSLGFNLGIGADGEPDGTGVLVRFGPTIVTNPPLRSVVLQNWSRPRHLSEQLFVQADLLTLARRTRTFTTAAAPGPVDHVSSLANSLRATQFIRGDPSPWYLVEIEWGLSMSEYAAGPDQHSRSIVAVASKAWSSSQWVLAFQDTGIVYQHRGVVPVVLSSARVRILNALTKQVEDGLGPSTFVLLQIERLSSTTPQITRELFATTNGPPPAAAVHDSAVPAGRRGVHLRDG